MSLFFGGEAAGGGGAGETEIANYLEDDWGDNALSSRTSTSDGVYAHPDANEAGDVLIGRYRPEWKIVSGSSLVSSGELVWDDSDGDNFFYATPSSFTVGSWQMDISISTSDSTDHGVALYLISSEAAIGPSDAYSTCATDSSIYRLRKKDSGSTTTIISGSWSVDGAYHTSKTTRDSYGNWELFNDGVSEGTTTDTFLPETRYAMIRFDESGTGTSTIKADNLVVK